jgi:hypothetical protein
MGQVYQCWWRTCRERNVFPRLEYHMFYVLYPFVTYLPTLPRTTATTNTTNITTTPSTTTTVAALGKATLLVIRVMKPEL